MYVSYLHTNRQFLITEYVAMMIIKAYFLWVKTLKTTGCIPHEFVMKSWYHFQWFSVFSYFRPTLLQRFGLFSDSNKCEASKGSFAFGSRANNLIKVVSNFSRLFIFSEGFFMLALFTWGATVPAFVVVFVEVGLFDICLFVLSSRLFV